jgi:hypothetical protein
MRVGATTTMSLLLLLSIGVVVSCGLPPSTTTTVASSCCWWNAVHRESWWWWTQNRTAATTTTPAATGNDSTTLVHPVEDNDNDSPRWSICSWWPFVGAPPTFPQRIPNEDPNNEPQTKQDGQTHRLESVRTSTLLRLGLSHVANPHVKSCRIQQLLSSFGSQKNRSIWLQPS